MNRLRTATLSIFFPVLIAVFPFLCRRAAHHGTTRHEAKSIFQGGAHPLAKRSTNHA